MKELLYEGSVKRVWQSSTRGNLQFEFTDDYSVFDWGKMPDTIANKGRALTMMGAFFFDYLGNPNTWISVRESNHLTRFNKAFLDARFRHSSYLSGLSKNGVRHHYVGLVDNPTKGELYLEVLQAQVLHPKPVHIAEQQLFYYPPNLQYLQSTYLSPQRRLGPMYGALGPSLRWGDNKDLSRPALTLVPLEILFRFGMPAGSSLKGRLEKNPNYAHVLGLKSIPQENSWFERPVIEFSTKLEDKDRLLSTQEALLISGLTPEQFEQLVEQTYQLALALYVVFANVGIELWDGKFEFAVDNEGLMLVDSIGPDELRLLYKGVHLSKEMIRQQYRGTTWEIAVKEAQALAQQRGVLDWKKICRDDLQEQPKVLSPAFKKVADQLYGVIANQVTNRKLFANHPSLDEFVSAVKP